MTQCLPDQARRAAWAIACWVASNWWRWKICAGRSPQSRARSQDVAECPSEATARHKTSAALNVRTVDNCCPLIIYLRDTECHLPYVITVLFAGQPTQVSAPRLNPSQPGHHSSYLSLISHRNGKLSWPWWPRLYFGTVYPSADCHLSS